jgi:DNA-3-methyladenine glycosylase
VTLPAELVRGPVEAAQALLGWTLLVDGVGGQIVETEAYAPDDPASHSYRGRSRRNGSMFAAAGTLYVYRSYGIHWCANVVTGREGEGAAVLLRALRPTHGLELMRLRRRVDDERLLCSGPGRLTMALAIVGDHDGASLAVPPFRLISPEGEVEVEETRRVGVTKAVERRWRFVVRGSRFATAGPRRA